MMSTRNCSVPGCQNKASGKHNKCSPCNYKTLIHPNHKAVLAQYKHDGTWKCLICGKDQSHRHSIPHGLCQKHYGRIVRHGDPHYLAKAESGSGSTFYSEKYKCDINKVLFFCPFRGRKITMEIHRFIAEQQIVKRPLGSNEVVHHKDGNHANNDISNLEILTPSEHTREHSPMMLARRWGKVARERSTAKLRILDLVNSSADPLSIKEVRERLGIVQIRTVREYLSRLHQSGHISRPARGQYRKNQ